MRLFAAKFYKSDRLLAWALEMPMPKAVDHMVRLLPSIVDPSKVCLSCKDPSRCACCAFGTHSANPAALALLAPPQQNPAQE